jgi:DNA-binding winged helix-turn-helix (wHTH) protein
MAKFILEDKVVYDSDTHSLFHIGKRDTQITLAIPASLCLLALLQNKDEPVSHAELLSFAWTSRGMNVSTNTVYQNVSILRKALVNYGLPGDMIKTVPKRGFVVLAESFSEFENNQEPVIDVAFVKSNTTTIIMEPVSDQKTTIVKKTKLRGVTSLLISTALCLFTFYGTYFLTERSEKNHSQYIYPEFSALQQTGDCHVYRNKSLRNDGFFIDFISSHMLKCEQQKWWYIFNYPPASQTFVLRCSSDLMAYNNNEKILCTSDYYF